MNAEPVWLDKAFVLLLHEIAIERTGGYQLESEKDNEQESLFLRLAESKVSHEELAEWYRQHAHV